ncbi:MAG: gfo/Idh/MocA family oxidoreductase, partial [Chthonomonadales bacterium]
KSPKSYVDLNKIDHGVMFDGSLGTLIADFGSRIILPLGDKSDMSYYKPRDKSAMLPNLGEFQKQWLDACKNPSLKTACDFEYSGNMIEQLLLGLVAYRVGKKIDYDGATGRVTNSSEANDLLKRQYRKGWTLNG